jgi:hypothetical protein
MYFVDCEASSLDSGSYPIEIAWVDASGHGESYLIRPEFSWTNWSAAAELIHGIKRATLAVEGKPASWVAQRVLTLKDAVLVSDNPSFEEYWIGELLATIRQQPLPVIAHDRVLTVQIHRLLALNTAQPDTPDWHRQSRRLMDRGQVIVGNAQFHAAAGRQVRHRALPDAEVLWRIWRLVKDEIDQILIEN